MVSEALKRCSEADVLLLDLVKELLVVLEHLGERVCSSYAELQQLLQRRHDDLARYPRARRDRRTA